MKSGSKGGRNEVEKYLHIIETLHQQLDETNKQLKKKRKSYLDMQLMFEEYDKKKTQIIAEYIKKIHILENKVEQLLMENREVTPQNKNGGKNDKNIQTAETTLSPSLDSKFSLQIPTFYSIY